MSQYELEMLGAEVESIRQRNRELDYGPELEKNLNRLREIVSLVSAYIQSQKRSHLRLVS